MPILAVEISDFSLGMITGAGCLLLGAIISSWLWGRLH